MSFGYPIERQGHMTQAEFIAQNFPGLTEENLVAMGANECDDCGGEFTPENLVATMAGWLCLDCNARLVGAVVGLAKRRL